MKPCYTEFMLRVKRTIQLVNWGNIYQVLKFYTTVKYAAIISLKPSFL